MTADQRVERLVKDYKRVEEFIAAQLRVALASPNISDRREAQRQIRVAQEALGGLKKPTEVAVVALTTAAVAEGVAFAGMELSALNIPPGMVAPVLSAPPVATTAAIAGVIAAELIALLAEARTVAGQRVTGLVNRARRQERISRLIQKPEVTDSNSNVVSLLERKGITGLVDRAGREWSISAYAAQVSDTLAHQARMDAAVARYNWSGLDYIKFHAEKDACPRCQKLHGNIASLDGSRSLGSVGVTPLSEFPDSPPVHPNCRCEWRPVLVRVPDVLAQAA